MPAVIAPETALQIKVATGGKLLAAARFYESVGYKVPIQASDRVVVVEDADLVIGVARIANEERVLILRGMQVSESYQRRGIGSLILAELDRLIGRRECWCLPYTHLDGFYSRIKFEQVDPDTAPPFLRERYDSYIAAGYDNIIMRRRAALGL
jgi:N-acetylglutamate synthase-like GNAT family acetyltransferase